MAYEGEAGTKEAKPETEKNSSLNSKTFDSSLQSYLAEVKKYPLLSRKEELEAIRKYQEQGDQETKDLIIVSNLRLVIKIAFRYHYSAIYFSQIDLIQEGNKGLIRATEKYDLGKNVKFSYYAAFWIKAYILKYITNNWSIVKFVTSEPKRKLFSQLKKEKNRLKQLGVDPDTGTIAKNLKVKQKDIEEIESLIENGDLSLDSPLKDGSQNNHIDLLSSETDLEEMVFKNEIKEKGGKMIADFRKILSEKELAVFDQRIYCQDPLTLDDLGKQFDLSRERIRQIEKGVYEKLDKFKSEGVCMQGKKEELSDVTLDEVRAVTKENTKSREISLLYFGAKNREEELTHQDIAEKVNCSLNYVNVAVGQTREKIKIIRKTKEKNKPSQKAADQNTDTNHDRTKGKKNPGSETNNHDGRDEASEPIHLLAQRGGKKFEMTISGGLVYDFLVKNLGL